MPARFGLFTPGPPALQLQQATFACVVALLFCFVSISAQIRAWEVSYKVQGISWLEVLFVWAMIQGVGIVAVAALWIVEWYGRRNDPLYLLDDPSRGNPHVKSRGEVKLTQSLN